MLIKLPPPHPNLPELYIKNQYRTLFYTIIISPVFKVYAISTLYWTDFDIKNMLPIQLHRNSN